MRYAMVLDLKRCVGCNACSVACKQEHGTPPGVLYSRVITTESGEYPNTRLDYLPILCMHCEEPSCEEVCPTGATHKLENGIVVVDADKCIGCRYCMVACPYNARFFNYQENEGYFPGGLTAYEAAKADQDNQIVGVVEKCNFCLDRVEQGLDPACVVTCPAQARIFGDLDDPTSEVSKLLAAHPAKQLHPETGNNPSVFYING